MKISYAEKLKDPRWRCRRQEIVDKAENRCEECGRNPEQLMDDGISPSFEVHHTCYVRGREPWEYPDDLLTCLCSYCHFERQVFDEEALFEFARMLRMMPLWHVYELKKRIRAKMDKGWQPALYDAWEELMKGHQ